MPLPNVGTAIAVARKPHIKGEPRDVRLSFVERPAPFERDKIFVLFLFIHSSLTYPAEREASGKQSRLIHHFGIKRYCPLHHYKLLADALKRLVSLGRYR